MAESCLMFLVFRPPICDVENGPLQRSMTSPPKPGALNVGKPSRSKMKYDAKIQVVENVCFNCLIWGKDLSQNFMKQNHHANQGTTLNNIINIPPTCISKEKAWGTYAIRNLSESSGCKKKNLLSLSLAAQSWRTPMLELYWRCGWVALPSEQIEFSVPFLIRAIETLVWQVQRPQSYAWS